MGLLATTVGVLVTIVGLLAGLAALHDWLRRQSPDLRWTSTGTSLQNIGKGTAEEISLAITTRLVQISKPYEVKESWPDPIPVTIPHLQPNEAIDVLDVQRAATKFVTGLEVLYREKFGSATVNLV